MYYFDLTAEEDKADEELGCCDSFAALRTVFQMPQAAGIETASHAASIAASGVFRSANMRSPL
jgi:hypothetical protein